MKKALKIILWIYAGICMLIVTGLVIAFIAAWTNFDKIVYTAIEQAEAASNLEIRELFDNNFPGKVTPPNLVKFIENDGPVKVATEIYESTVVKYESIIMMNRQKSATGAAVTIAILLNGKPVATIENGQELNLPSPNGSLTIVAMNMGTGQKTPELVFEAASAVITFTTGFNASGIFLEKVKEEPF